MISDVLISSTGKTEHKKIATFDDLDNLKFSSEDYKVSGTTCKLFIVGDRLAVGWAGSQWEAQSVIRHIHASLNESFNFEHLKDLLSIRFSEGKAEVTLVGCIISGTTAVVFRWDGTNGEINTGPYFAEGSGARSFQMSLAPADLIISTEYSKAGDPIMDAASWGIRRIATLLGGEILEGANLSEHFGGGFDVVVFDGHSFRRVASLVQVFLGVEIISWSNPYKIKIRLRATSFWQRFKDGLEIERIDVDENDVQLKRNLQSGFTLSSKIRRKVHSKASVFHPVDCGEKQPVVPDFAAVHIQMLLKDGNFGKGCFVYELPNKDIKIVKYSGCLRIQLSGDFFKSISSSLNAHVMQDTSVREMVEAELSRERI